MYLPISVFLLGINLVHTAVVKNAESECPDPESLKCGDPSDLTCPEDQQEREILPGGNGQECVGCLRCPSEGDSSETDPGSGEDEPDLTDGEGEGEGSGEEDEVKPTRTYNNSLLTYLANLPKPTEKAKQEESIESLEKLFEMVMGLTSSSSDAVESEGEAPHSKTKREADASDLFDMCPFVENCDFESLKCSNPQPTMFQTIYGNWCPSCPVCPSMEKE